MLLALTRAGPLQGAADRLPVNASTVCRSLKRIETGLALGLLPLFLAQGRNDLVQLTDCLDECQTELWLLTHTESRHLRRVSTVFGHLSQSLRLA